MKKNILLILACLLFSDLGFAQDEPFLITHGPYLQNMGETA